jgi:hypothetical protein
MNSIDTFYHGTTFFSMPDKFEIIVIGYRWHTQTLERTIDSILRTNKRHFKVNVGINAPTPLMLAMIQKYHKYLNLIYTNGNNLNKVGMQKHLVHKCCAKYIVSFDDDSYVIHKDWQDFLIERIESYEKQTLRYFGDFGNDREAHFKRLTDNTIGIFGLIFYDFLDTSKRALLAKSSWYDPVNKLNHEAWNSEYKKDQIWFCTGAFYVFLREPYIKFNYPGFEYKMAYEDVILSYFFQHHGYRLGDLGGGFLDSGLDTKNKYTALGSRLILNDSPRSYNMDTVELEEHSLNNERPNDRYINEYL